MKLERILGDFPNHTVHYVLQAHELDAVHRFLDPGWKICSAKITPVTESVAT